MCVRCRRIHNAISPFSSKAAAHFRNATTAPPLERKRIGFVLFPRLSRECNVTIDRSLFPGQVIDLQQWRWSSPVCSPVFFLERACSWIHCWSLWPPPRCVLILRSGHTAGSYRASVSIPYKLAKDVIKDRDVVSWRCRVPASASPVSRARRPARARAARSFCWNIHWYRFYDGLISPLYCSVRSGPVRHSLRCARFVVSAWRSWQASWSLVASIDLSFARWCTVNYRASRLASLPPACNVMSLLLASKRRQLSIINPLCRTPTVMCNRHAAYAIIQRPRTMRHTLTASKWYVFHNM